MGDPFRLARSRSRAISFPRHQVARDRSRPLDDLRLPLDAATSHEHDAIADRRVDHVAVRGVDPVADVLMARREFGPPGVHEDEIGEALHADEPRVDPEGPRASRVRELERLDRREGFRIATREFLEERGGLHGLEHVQAIVARGPQAVLFLSVFIAPIRLFASAAVRSSFLARSRSFSSPLPPARIAHRPISFTAFAACSIWKYMSLKVLVPVLIISRHANFVP